jgi:uncharacterized protein (DUF169 family)
MLLLRYEPVAIKLVAAGEEIPETAIRPLRDMNKHLALCQAIALARRNGRTFYLDKRDHWCWNPLVGLGLVDCSEGTEAFEVVCQVLGIADLDAARAFFAKFPRLPFGQYEGIIIAPLRACTVEPDIVLFYVNNAQLRTMVWATKRETGRLVETQLDAIDSCVYAIVTPMLSGEYRVTLPDMGEHERAMAEEHEVIFSVPWGRMKELLRGLRFFDAFHMGYGHLSREMELDFKRPPFYNKLFELWGLDQGDDWGK